VATATAVSFTRCDELDHSERARAAHKTLGPRLDKDQSQELNH
jgi:hypothetical protein